MMYVTDRKENPLLDRVEIVFSIRHEGIATPSRSDIISEVATAEPGAKRDQIIVKNVSTRFGQSLTTGTAHIYGAKESMTVESPYLLERHGEKKKTESPKEKSPEPTEDDGGEE